MKKFLLGPLVLLLDRHQTSAFQSCRSVPCHRQRLRQQNKGTKEKWMRIHPLVRVRREKDVVEAERTMEKFVSHSRHPVRARLLRTVLLSMAASLVAILWKTSSAVAASACTVTKSSSAPAVLGSRNILSAAALLISLACLPLRLSGMGPLAKALAVSASRCAVQVSLLGIIVLQKIMGVTHPFYVLAWVFGVGILTGRESIARIQYTYPNMERNMYLSSLMGGLTVLGMTMGLQLLGNVQPWFDPRVWISIAGMLFGNTLNASALGAATITKQFATQTDAVELRLVRGATMQQAVQPLMEESYRTALTPTINGLAATGIIHIPGMMTGQILAGQSPQQAALYQIMINFLIATVATFTCQLVISSTVKSLVNTRQTRLNSGVLNPRANSKKISFLSSFRRKPSDIEEQREEQAGDVHETDPVSVTCTRLIKSDSSKTRKCVLELSNLSVAKAGIKLDNLVVNKGDRIAVTGKSGIGKSQLLRTIVGLEESENKSSRVLAGSFAPLSEIVDFRKKVALVPQNSPSLERSPRDLLAEFQQYHSDSNVDSTTQEHQLFEIAEAWGLDENVLDQPFSTLSGGQAQRATLAITMCLQPKVLLLDESTNALDETSSRAVEKTLIDSGMSIIVVTHSQEQLYRFCTHQIELL